MRSEYLPLFVRIALTAIILGLFLWMFVPFATPIVMAALFGFGLDPSVSRFGLKKKRRKLPTLMILLGIFFAILAPASFVVYRCIDLLSKMASHGVSSIPSLVIIQKSLADVRTALVAFAHRYGIDTTWIEDPSQWISNLARPAALVAAEIVKQTPELIIDLLIFSAALYFFLTESKMIKQLVSRLQLINCRELEQIITSVQRTSYLTLVVSAVIGGVQALIVASGAWFFGYPEFVLIFVLTYIVSFIPVVGAGPVAAVLAIASLVQGEYTSAIALGVVTAVAGSIDNILKPLIVSQSSEEDLNPVISTLAIVGAVIVYGLPGLLLGPILTELAFKIVPILFDNTDDSSRQSEL